MGRAAGLHDTRRKRRQHDRIAHIQRQVGNAHLIDNQAAVALLRLERLRVAGNRDRFGHRTHL